MKSDLCEDAVSRKAVGYLLAHYVDESKYRQAIYDLRHLPSVTPKQRWIPCDVRMPEEHDSIFAKFKGSDRWNSLMWEKTVRKSACDGRI